jgi:inner membrane protein
LRARSAAGALAAIAVADLLLPRARASRIASGILDETAHLLTGIAALAASGATDGPGARGLIAGSVALDADHVPDALGYMLLRSGRARPYPHTLLTPAVVVLAGRRAGEPRRRRFAAGLAGGLTLHLVRDLASGQGIRLLWPLSATSFRVPYPVYLALVAAMGVRASRDGGSTRAS